MLQTNSRIDIMSQLVQINIEVYLQDQTAVGIVSFEDVATVLTPATVITSFDERRNLASKVPTFANGGTNIIAVLQKCHWVTIINVHTSLLALSHD